MKGGGLPDLPAARSDAAAWQRAIAARLRAARVAFGHGAGSAAVEALWMVAHVLECSFDELLADPGRLVPSRAASRLARLVERRCRGRIPLAYLLGEAWLGPYRFAIDRRVIVPRSFIAFLLLERLQPWLPRPDATRRILDLCTGSGCLAILAAHAFPQARVDAVDLSRRALAVAERNRRAHRVAGRVRLLEGDLFRPLAGRRYDLVLANPPYVDRAALRRLPPEYRTEPRLALDGGPDGLSFAHRILRAAAGHLRPGGWLVIEIGRHRRRLERAYPQLDFVWPAVPGGSGAVAMIAASGLAALSADAAS